jgi:stage II sporulation protein D
MKKNLFFFSLIFVFGAVSLSSAKEIARVRVLLAKDVPEIVISVEGPYDIMDVRRNTVMMSGRKGTVSRVVAVKEGLRIKDAIFATDALAIIPKKKAAVTVRNRRYRGDITFFKDPSGKILVVNTVELESYVKGVLYHEISHKWPMDAIKAQAVAVRTYALYQKEVMKNKNYDVTADTSSQVYGGFFAETNKTNRAVNFTKDEVLLYHNKLFPAYFHATCGGITENAAELWKIDMEPLQGGRVCGFCQDSPHYFWKIQTDLNKIQEKLGSLYTLKSPLKNIAVVERNASGRVRSLEFKDALEKTQVIAAKDFRLAFGADQLRSTNFSILFEGDRVIFAGKGWGHGVGLCQWGALGMSKQGLSYVQILEFYYPGARILRLSSC